MDLAALEPYFVLALLVVVFATMATLIPSLGLGLLSFRQSEAQISANVTRELAELRR